MSDIANPHDAFFRETLSRRKSAISFMRVYLPEPVVRCLDLESLDIVDHSSIDAKLRAHLSDFIGRVRLRDGGDAYVYVLVEHKTTPQRMVAFQLLRYATQLWHRHVAQGRGFPLPPVIPIVFYHGRRPWTVSTEFSAVFRCPDELKPYLPGFRFLLTDLTRHTDEEIRGIDLLLAPLLAMRHYYDPDLLERIPGILRALAGVVNDQPGLDALMALLEYLSSTNRVGDRDLEQAVEEAFPGGEGHRIMETIADRWIQQGIERGIEQGIQRGAAAKAREDVLEVLVTRFQTVPQALRARINRIEEVDALGALLRTALTVASLESFERTLDDSGTVRRHDDLS